MVFGGIAPESRYEAALALTGHPGDGGVLADAWQSGTDFSPALPGTARQGRCAAGASVVTLDRQHFLDNEALRAALPFPLGTPGDFLLWYRQSYIEKGT